MGVPNVPVISKMRINISQHWEFINRVK